LDLPTSARRDAAPWVTSGNRAPFHIEGIDAPAPGVTPETLSSPLVVEFQLRPDPLTL